MNIYFFAQRMMSFPKYKNFVFNDANVGDCKVSVSLINRAKHALKICTFKQNHLETYWMNR